MKVLVVTLTCGRLDVSRTYVPTLAEKAGDVDYEHIIVDNGSRDRTPDWFTEQGYEVVRNSHNEGVARGWRIGFEAGKKYDPDVVVRMDDDCEIESGNILADIVTFYEEEGPSYVVSPMNVSLLRSPDYMPKTIEDRDRLGRWNVNLTTHSGLFVCVPRSAFELMIDQGMVEGDRHRGDFWRERGYATAYLTDLRVHHMGSAAAYEKYAF